MSTIAPEERLIAAIAALILDPEAPPVRHAAVGAASAIPAAACWLVARQGHPLRLSLLHRPHGNPFTEGSRELFDLAGQGRIDLFFLGGGQIDAQANLNLIGTGEWPGTGVRFPGSFGSAFMYFAVPRTILFREEHSRRVLVPRVDIVSAPGVSPPGVWRRGTAQALVTGKCVFRFNRAHARFRLASVHPGETAESVRMATGFDFDGDANPPCTPDPTPHQIELMRGPVCDEMLETYPAFCRRVWGRGSNAERAA
ncbi:CoA synthetase [Rhodovastum atsumiense]|uniref:CoA synthetase n=1 Tax=Rhodovastum atsumiense TaxID=504468 RepID=A0A5M6IYJ4_9PROT|nr:CoA-transferase [Rhodovastum atsumiense]KAA5612445.1 CoA synthetase [Rhodovastum atsumiense]CAH2600353.1 CoA synthetase [Rhodovastum atsumiense]